MPRHDPSAPACFCVSCDADRLARYRVLDAGSRLTTDYWSAVESLRGEYQRLLNRARGDTVDRGHLDGTLLASTS